MHSVSVGDHVLLVEHVPYRVRKLFPDQQAVCLQKINSRDPPFKRSVRQLWFPPPATNDMAIDVDLPTSNCLCPEPVPPRALPDVSDNSTQVDLHTSKALDEWCSLMTDFSSVDKLDQAFHEARAEAEKYYKLFADSQQELATLRANTDRLQLDNENLRNSLTDLNASHNALIAQSLQQLDQLSNLRSQLPNQQPSILPLLRTLLLTLPTDFEDEDTPDDTLYHFLCSSPHRRLCYPELQC